jgi:hypothetical protein
VQLAIFDNKQNQSFPLRREIIGEDVITSSKKMATRK